MLCEEFLYGRQYFEQYQHDAKRAVAYQQEFHRLQNFIPTSGRVLDVGAGIGNFLDLFPSDKWQKVAVEISDYASETCAKKGILTLVDTRHVAANSCDVVVYRGTLQHIYEPMASLIASTIALKENGTLAVLATPDTDSWVYQIWKRLPALDAPRNWVLFGSTYLKNILGRLGYDIIEVNHPYRNSPYAKPIQDFCNFGLSLVAGYRPFAFPGNMMEIFARKKIT